MSTAATAARDRLSFPSVRRRRSTEQPQYNDDPRQDIRLGEVVVGNPKGNVNYGNKGRRYFFDKV